MFLTFYGFFAMFEKKHWNKTKLSRIKEENQLYKG